jgi:anti-sigma regulatory factor (Ser/Thr protein kinase)
MDADYTAELGLRPPRETRARADSMRDQAIRLRREASVISEQSAQNLMRSSTRLFGDRGSVLWLRLPRLGPAIALARQSLHRWLERDGVAPDEAFEVVLACSEALANAVEHPVTPTHQAIEVEARREHGELHVEVRDFGAWSQRRRQSIMRGRGLPMIRSLMDRVEIVPSKEGTRVVMHRSLGSPRPRPL